VQNNQSGNFSADAEFNQWDTWPGVLTAGAEASASDRSRDASSCAMMDGCSEALAFVTWRRCFHFRHFFAQEIGKYFTFF
jgi:hypothetical protein